MKIFSFQNMQYESAFDNITTDRNQSLVLPIEEMENAVGCENNNR